MPILGAHLSIAGGYYRAVEQARRLGCDCVQLFTKNCNQWRAKEITDEEASRFRRAVAETRIEHAAAHDSYLINLAAADEVMWRKSLDALVVELDRAGRLGIPYVITHPGAYGMTSEQEGIRRIVAALDQVHQLTDGGVKCLLETTAGQGTSLGWKFEQLAAIFDGVREPERLGVCVDTCHVFAAGYPLAPRREYEATMAALGRLVGLGRIKAFHLNDSKKDRGSRVDRHAHIGEGKLGLEPFRLLLNDPRFRHVPMYIETPKGERDGEPLDAINLRTLRGLVGTTAPSARPRRAKHPG